jgi:hypothetical protein
MNGHGGADLTTTSDVGKLVRAINVNFSKFALKDLGKMPLEAVILDCKHGIFSLVRIIIIK